MDFFAVSSVVDIAQRSICLLTSMALAWFTMRKRICTVLRMIRIYSNALQHSAYCEPNFIQTAAYCISIYVRI